MADIQQSQQGPLSIFSGQQATGRSSGPLLVHEGRVIRAFPGMQLYEVVVGNSRIMAGYAGASTGQGVSNPVSFGVGSRVLVAADLDNPDVSRSFIICATPRPVGHGFDHGRRSLTDVPLSGTSIIRPATGNRLSRLLHPNLGGSCIQGVVDGDWLVLSESGTGGLGVEYFRIWVGGGPMNGLWFYPDAQTTKLAGLNFQFLTAGQEDLDRVLGNQTERVRRRVYTIQEAEEEREPRELSVTGLIHSGHQHFFGPADAGEFDRPGSGTYADDADDDGSGQQVEPDEDDTARPTLHHYHVGLDGAIVISSATSVTLQKYIGIPMPTEIIEGAPVRDPEPEDPPDAPTDVYPKAVDDTQTLRGREGGHCGVRYTQRDASIVSGNPLDSVVLAVQQVEARVNYVARQGFDLLDKEWVTKGRDKKVYEHNLQHGWRFGEWLCMPRVVAVPISAGRSRNIYVGRSIITILDDGSIVLQDAFNSSITMSKGSIILQAPEDIIAIAGGDTYMLAGKNAGVQGRNAVEVISAEGSLSLRSSGAVGVQAPGMDVDTPDQDEEQAEFVLSVRGKVALEGRDMLFRSRGGLHLEMEDPLSWRLGGSTGVYGEGFIGSTISARFGGDNTLMLGDGGSYIPNLSVGSLVAGKQTRASTGRISSLAGETLGRFVSYIEGKFADFGFDQPDFDDEDREDLAAAGSVVSPKVIPEPSWLTYYRINHELDQPEAGLAVVPDQPSPSAAFPVGIPSAWQVRRIAVNDSPDEAEGERPTGFIDYATGGYSVGATSYPRLEDAPFAPAYYGLQQQAAQELAADPDSSRLSIDTGGC